MPHTSRKKKNAPTKRIEIIDDDGWTRVTTTNRQQRAPRVSQSDTHLLPSSDVWKTMPENGVTIEKLAQGYEKVREQWLASDACRALTSLLENKVLSSNDIPYDKCFIFGSGSICGLKQGWISRKTTAMCQLAVLQTIQRTIEAKTDRTLPVYAQDPAYNDVDIHFLTNLKMDVVETPAGFDLITDKSLVYTPCAELYVDMEVLKRKPAALLTGKLDWYWRNEKGLACTRRLATDVEDKRISLLDVLETSEEPRLQQEGQALRSESMRDLENECQVLENFVRDKQEAYLPVFDYKDDPFTNQYLYWPNPHEDVEDAKTCESVK